MSEDRIYSMPLEHVGDFNFDQRVVEVFPDMISRSVPGYGSVLAMTTELAARYAADDSHIYDLGCSLGAVSLMIRDRVPAGCTIHAIDSSAAMVKRLCEITSEHDQQVSPHRATIICQHADVRGIELRNASFAILNFTLQFIPLAERDALLQSIYDGMHDGGALVLSEKVHFDDRQRQSLMTELHHDFKRANGYSDLEIAQKRTALENTLVTETIEQHQARLSRAGFSGVSLWFQCFNFVSILAVK